MYADVRHSSTRFISYNTTRRLWLALWSTLLQSFRRPSTDLHSWSWSWSWSSSLRPQPEAEATGDVETSETICQSAPIQIKTILFLEYRERLKGRVPRQTW